MRHPRLVRKRDGRLVPFRREKIAEAIFRAAQSIGGEDRFLADELAGVVAAQLAAASGGPRRRAARAPRSSQAPTIEDVQDAVERVLIETGHARTAKAYILYRNRRADARRTRAHAEKETAPTPLPVVGDPGGLPEVSLSHTEPAGLLRSAVPSEAEALAPAESAGDGDPVLGGWSKARIVAALVDGDGLTRPEAEDVARTVEARILSSRVAHVSEALVRALVAAEVFERGTLTRLAEDRYTGLEHEALDRALAVGLSDRRATNPAAFAEGVGEALLARHVLDHVLPPEAASAHRAGDLHVYDLGAPLRLTSIAIDAPRVVEQRLAGDAFTTRSGARRVVAALEDVVLGFAPHAARALALENLNVVLAPFVAQMDEEALSEGLRHFLLGPVLRWSNARSLGGRGGLLRLELGLTSGIPASHRARPAPAPAPPGRTYGDYANAAHRVTRALLTEVAALMHEGHEVGVGLTLTLDRNRKHASDAAEPRRRALEGDALRTAALVGEPLIVLDGPGRPSRGSSWHRVTEREVADPLRFDKGDVSAAGTIAVNLVGPALRTRASGLSDFLREAERLVQLALDACQARQGALFRASGEPGGTLYGIACGHHPLVDLESAHHLIELVGLDQAAVLLSRRGGDRARQALRQRLALHLGRRVSHEAAARRLCACVVEGVSDEAALRFAAVDRGRFPETVRWWGDGEVPSYAPVLSTGRRREGAGLDLYGDAESGSVERPRLRIQHRIDREDAVPLDTLRRVFDEAVKDPNVCQYRLGPWPRRHVRVARGRASGAS